MKIEDHPNALTIPPVTTVKSHEILRIWEQEDGKIAVSLTLERYDARTPGDPIDWGVVLHDAAKIVADAYVEKVFDRRTGLRVDRQHVLDRIKQGFVEEHDDPTTSTHDVPLDGGS